MSFSGLNFARVDFSAASISIAVRPFISFWGVASLGWYGAYRVNSAIYRLFRNVQGFALQKLEAQCAYTRSGNRQRFIQDWNERFRQIDRDKNGKISRHELQAALSSYRFQILDFFFDAIGITGEAEKKQFLAQLVRQNPQLANILQGDLWDPARELHKELDLNNDGGISEEEWRVAGEKLIKMLDFGTGVLVWGTKGFLLGAALSCFVGSLCVSKCWIGGHFFNELSLRNSGAFTGIVTTYLVLGPQKAYQLTTPTK